MIYDYMCHIFNTVFRLYQNPFNKKWDALLNMLMVFGTVVEFDEYAVTFEYNDNRYTVWIENRYYSYAWLHGCSRKYTADERHMRPKFKTMLRLNKLVAKLNQPS